MVAMNPHWLQHREEWIAHLTDSAYRAVLERGFKGSFLELELSLWHAVRAAVELAGPDDPARRTARPEVGVEVV